MVDHLVVVANGAFSRPAPLTALARNADLLVAADGGANWLHEQGLMPNALIGDLDSVRPAVLADLTSRGCIIQRHPTAKDETDTELALLYATEQAPTRITLIGALGGRVDHELANILLLALPELSAIPTAIYDGLSWVRLLVADDTGARAVIQGTAGDIVSLLPLGGDCQGVSTEQMAYPLENETLRFGPARGVSNSMLATTAQVTVRSGRLLIVHTPAEPPFAAAHPAEPEET
ncbi:MAG: thiamine diphosphokinase [Anaerolineales bacterium]